MSTNIVIANSFGLRFIDNKNWYFNLQLSTLWVIDSDRKIVIMPISHRKHKETIMIFLLKLGNEINRSCQKGSNEAFLYMRAINGDVDEAMKL